MKLILETIFLCLLSIISFNGSESSYRYEAMHNFGAAKRIPNFHALARQFHEHPQPLPVSRTVDPMALVPQPYPSVIQGRRSRNDSRVYDKAFQYPPVSTGHQVVCDHLLNCTITCIVVKTRENIPIILRGGAGYRHFTVVVKAKSGVPLDASIKAYCKTVMEDTL